MMMEEVLKKVKKDEEEIKQKRLKLFKEILDSEFHYISYLKFFVEKIKIPLINLAKIRRRKKKKKKERKEKN